ncbi:uncharacterized protein LOC142798508 [Rhipicephalus microplus]|uniref:uncharacterized protein LOC142798508 n=1 Tax=Rhipicephalus microplus TaxID=6941 RepID=UPI003F6D8CBB
MSSWQSTACLQLCWPCISRSVRNPDGMQNTRPTSLEVYWEGGTKKWHNRALVDKEGKCHSVYSDETSKNIENTTVIDVKVSPGDFYSPAVRLTDTKYFQGTSYEGISKFKHPPGSTLFVEFSVTDPSKK